MNQFKIFPYGVLPDGRRIPLISEWEAKASNDPTQHNHWLQQFGDRIKGWALPVGINGLYALDIDVKGQANGFQYLNDRGIQLPQTAYQTTPSGGVHLFFKQDPSLGLKNTVNRDIGIDGRSEGGFVWLYNPRFDIPVAPIPEWLPQILKRPVPQIDPSQQNLVKLDQTVAMQRFQEALTMLSNAQEGERNATLNKVSYVIGQLVKGGGIPLEFAQSEITRVAQSIGLDHHEIQATSMSGLKGGALHPLTHPFGDKPPVPALPMETLPGPRWTPALPTLQDLTDWSKLRQPQLFKDWSTQDIILTSAVGGVGKSTIKLYESVCLALGESFLGFECLNPGRTLFITGEDTEKKLYAMLGRICHQMGLFEPGQEHRLQAVRTGVAIKLASDLSLVGYSRTLNNYVPNMEAIDKIKEAIEDLQPKQIIFDPVGIFGGSEAGGNDSAKAMMQAMHKIREISDVSIDIISHIGKNSATMRDTSQFSARGATSLANHSRVVRTLLKLNADEYREVMGEVLDEGKTAIQCFISKFSDGSPWLDRPFMIVRDGYLFSRKDIPQMQGGQGAGDQSKQQVYEFIKFNSSETKPMSEEVIANYLSVAKPKVPKSTTKAHITSLEFEGLVERVESQDVTVGTWVRVRIQSP